MPQPSTQLYQGPERRINDAVRRLERRVAHLESHRLVTLDRRDIDQVPAPGEGEIVYEASTTTPRAWYYRNGEWCPLAPPGFSFKLFADPGSLDGNLPDTATVVSTGDGKYEFGIPRSFDGLDLVHVEAYVSTVSSSGTITVQVRNSTSAVDVLSTRVTINSGAHHSRTATPYVINAANARATWGHMWALDVDVAGTNAQGLGVDLEFGRLA